MVLLKRKQICRELLWDFLYGELGKPELEQAPLNSQKGEGKDTFYALILTVRSLPVSTFP